jgi:birA, biotin-[acetyl-CoA-carboxylase] ligase region
MTRHFETLDSTNDEAMRLALAGAPAFDAVSAASQTAGRGRHGRAWASPPGVGLYVSVILRPRVAPDLLPLSTLLAGIAAAEAIRGTSGADAKIKWPNDILINGRKTAGLLCEADFTSAVPIVIAGLGVNVNTLPQDLPARAIYPATSIFAETQLRNDPATLLDAWIERLRFWIASIESDPAASALISRWNELDALRGEHLRVSLADGTAIEGVESGTDPEGHLLLRLSDGALFPVMAGDIAKTSAPRAAE